MTLVWLCAMLLCWLAVFLFKQKTAYEVRISDWSSDVCSSDLTLSGDEMVSALEAVHVDIAVGAYPSLVAGIKTQRLYQEEYLCFGKEGHPFIKSGETDDFMAADHIVVSTKGMAHAHRAVERALLDKIHPDRIRIV